MTQFRVGDKVRQKTTCSGTKAGEICVLKMGDKNGNNLKELWAWNENTTECGCHCQGNWELIEPVLVNNNFGETAVERMGSGFVISQTPEDKPKNKIMSIIKDIFKSKEQKALSQYGITNGDGGLTGDGRGEFVDYLWETDKETRKAFISKVIEKYEEDKKK